MPGLLVLNMLSTTYTFKATEEDFKLARYTWVVACWTES